MCSCSLPWQTVAGPQAVDLLPTQHVIEAAGLSRLFGYTNQESIPPIAWPLNTN